MQVNTSILLVEDDEDDQFLFIEALQKIDHVCLFAIANNGKEALNRLENASALPSIIFMDINMPVMNGIECLRKIKGNSFTKNIPVVMLSTSNKNMDIFQQIGANSFIQKPSDGKFLSEQLKLSIRKNTHYCG